MDGHNNIIKEEGTVCGSVRPLSPSETTYEEEFRPSWVNEQYDGQDKHINPEERLIGQVNTENVNTERLKIPKSYIRNKPFSKRELVYNKTSAYWSRCLSFCNSAFTTIRSRLSLKKPLQIPYA